MKRPYKVLLISVGIVLSLYLAARITGILQFYTTRAASMTPTLKAGTRFITSNLKKPKRNDIVSFQRVLTEKDFLFKPGEKLTFASRLIAFGGETIQIKDGLAFVDGKLVDDSTLLRFRYLTTEEDFKKVIDVLKIDLNSAGGAGSIDQPSFGAISTISLNYDEYIRAEKVATLIKDTLSKDGRFDLFNNDENKQWTVNNYGPIKIPADFIFVLGDNRNLSDDSRYFGPIPKKNIVGTLITTY